MRPPRLPNPYCRTVYFFLLRTKMLHLYSWVWGVFVSLGKMKPINARFPLGLSQSLSVKCRLQTADWGYKIQTEGKMQTAHQRWNIVVFLLHVSSGNLKQGYSGLSEWKSAFQLAWIVYQPLVNLNITQVSLNFAPVTLFIGSQWSTWEHAVCIFPWSAICIFPWSEICIIASVCTLSQVRSLRFTLTV